jgi:hypothetical protein
MQTTMPNLDYLAVAQGCGVDVRGAYIVLVVGMNESRDGTRS